MDLQMKQFFLVPIASAYVTFIFSGYLTKWAKEMESPYTYLIPDKPIRKLWYATLIEHIRSAADGLLVTLPAAVVLGLPLGYILLNVLFYVCLQANKLYFSVLSESLLGNVLGNTGKTILRMVGQMIVITIAVVIAAVVTIAVNFTAGFFGHVPLHAGNGRSGGFRRFRCLRKNGDSLSYGSRTYGCSFSLSVI